MAEATLVPEISVGELDGDEEYLFDSILVDEDHVWAVTWGESGMQRVVRLRIELGGG